MEVGLYADDFFSSCCWRRTPQEETSAGTLLSYIRWRVFFGKVAFLMNLAYPLIGFDASVETTPKLQDYGSSPLAYAV